MNELAFFAGAGGGILGGHLLGWRTVCAVELDPYAASVLVARQNDGILSPFPIWDDVRTFDGRPWRGIVDVVSGGFPCQDISVAGKGAGIDGERSGLWGEMARIIGEVRPRFAFVENSPALVTRGLGRVLGDLAALGYDCRWTVLGAADVGAPHKRDRLWLVGTDSLRDRCKADHGRELVRDADPHGAAHATGRQEQQSGPCRKCGDVADANSAWQLQQGGTVGEEWGRACDGSAALSNAECVRWGEVEQAIPGGTREQGPASSPVPSTERWWLAEPDVGGTFDGMAGELDVAVADEQE